jgi:hypothetical protein
VTTKQSPRTPIEPRDLNAPFFNLRETAWLLHCSYETVSRAIKAGLLPCSQRVPGGVIVVTREDMAEYHRRTRTSVVRTRRSTAKPARAAA